MWLRTLAPLLLLAALLGSAGTAGAQNATPDVNATPPGEVNESVEDFGGPAGSAWSWFAIVVGVLMGAVLVVILWKRPRDRTRP